MSESKPSDTAERPRDFTTPWVTFGLVAIVIGAGLFHPGAGLILGGLVAAAIGLFGAPKRTS